MMQVLTMQLTAVPAIEQSKLVHWSACTTQFWAPEPAPSQRRRWV